MHYSLHSIPPERLATCDCYVQLLEALRQEVKTWRIGNVPNTEEWMRECAAWIVQLRTEDRAQDWMMLLTFAIHNHMGLSVHTASALLQQHVGEAMVKKGANA